MSSPVEWECKRVRGPYLCDQLWIPAFEGMREEGAGMTEEKTLRVFATQ